MSYCLKRNGAKVLGMAALLVVLLAVVPTAQINAQAAGVCHPESGICVEPTFVQQWNRMGGLGGGRGPGYPMAEPEWVTYEGRDVFAQVFERAMITFDPSTGLTQGGLIGSAYRECLNIVVGYSSVEGQLNRDGVYTEFSRVWNISRWGYPITAPFWMDDGNGGQIVAQLFERGRLELHTAPLTTLAGRLGAELIDAGYTTSQIVNRCG
jgi:hypothetical protein